MNRAILPAVLCAVLAVSACGGSDGAEQQAGTTEQAGVPAAEPAAPVAADTVGAAPLAGAPAMAPAAAPASGAFRDPNAASREELLAIPGLTPALADAVIGGRPHADMRSVDRALAGLSEPQRDEVYGRLWKPLDLNKATAQEIELIPRVGGKMRHEFEEYRPYRNVAQFRREIGKYVDEAEVARLERYVAIGS